MRFSVRFIDRDASGAEYSRIMLLEKDGTWKLIRRAETPKDYFATLDFTPEYKKMFPEEQQ